MEILPTASNPGRAVATKICGITNADDAFAAVAAGAEMLGFNFYNGSRRFIDPDDAGAIIRSVRKRGPAECVGVFVDAAPEEIRDIAGRSGIDAVQLHGNETPDECDILRPLRVIKALRVYAGFDPAVVAAFQCDAILLDTWHADERGGTGAVFDWEIAAEIRRNVSRLILAGGLTVKNVAAAIRKVRPDVVDVCSGIEDSARRKNAARMREFIEEVRNAAVAEFGDLPQRTT
jgi:phosphoribosylanthranilate isomerase